jgi:phage terminase small subunit
MPASKPLALLSENDRHRTRKEIRAAEENAKNPNVTLPSTPPRALDGLRVAQETWRRLIRLYRSTKGTIITAFDRDVLIEYCRSCQELAELRILRKNLMKGGKDIDLLLQVDARLDRKATRLDGLRSVLYLTPRSRAGVSPVEKEPEDLEEQPIPIGGYDVKTYLKTKSWTEEK